MEIHDFAARVAAEICELPADQQAQVIDIITNKVIGCQEANIENIRKHLNEKEAALSALKSKLVKQ